MGEGRRRRRQEKHSFSVTYFWMFPEGREALSEKKKSQKNERTLNVSLFGPKGVQLWRCFGLKPLCKLYTKSSLSYVLEYF